MIKKEFLARKIENKIQTLQEHSQNVAVFCSVFLENFNIPCIARILGEIHDFGKACGDFAERLENKNVTVEHSSSGAVWLLQQSLDESLTNNERIVLQAIAFAVSSHHMVLGDLAGNYQSRLDEIFSKLSNAQFSKNYNEMLINCGENLQDLKNIIFSDDFKKDCKQAISIIKNVINKEPYSENLNYLTQFYLGMFIRLLYSVLIDADRTDAMNFELSKNEKSQIDINKKFCQIADYMDANSNNYEKTELNKIRGEIYDFCVKKSQGGTGLYELNVQTGGGKTLSGFRFAIGNAIENKLTKIIYVVPFISIIEQNAKVIKDLLKNVACDDMVIESHSNAVVFNDNAINSKFDKFFTNWNEPIIFTTMVGFLESVYGKPSQNNRRFHNLANSVIIFDEVQALPKKCVGLFNLLIKFLQNAMNCTIVLCTATQPTLSHLEKYSSNKDEVKMLCLGETQNIVDKTYSELKRAEIIFEDNTLNKENAITYILDKFQSVNNLLVVVNTKRAARELFWGLKPNAKCYHLSTNMCAEHRLNTINTVKKALQNNERIILISTQLIEAGVDLDFECVIRSKSGLDSIIQVAGRCNREGKLKDANGNKKLGQVFVVGFDNTIENLSHLKDIFNGQKYLLNCRQMYDDVTCESSIKHYFYQLYSNASELKYKYSKGENLVDELCGKQSKIDKANRFTNLTMNFRTVADNFKVIEDKNTVSVLVPYGYGNELIQNLNNVSDVNAKKCQRFLVEVDVGKIANYSQYEANTGIWYATTGYDDEVGLTDEVQKIEFEGGFLL
ncbi:MAG: CRISPR-associated helicase Cas3' [Christensenellales bacterium]